MEMGGGQRALLCVHTCMATERHLAVQFGTANPQRREVSGGKEAWS